MLSKLQTLNDNQDLAKNSTDLLLELTRSVSYAKYDSIHSASRPIVPKSIQLDIFKLVYDNLGYVR